MRNENNHLILSLSKDEGAWTRTEAVLMRRDVYVPQHVRFRFKVVKPLLDHVTDADDAGEPSIFDHRQLANAMTRHQAHGALYAVVRCDGDDGESNDVLHPHRERVCIETRQRIHDVALRHDAHDRATTLHHQRRHASLAHLIDGLLHRRCGLDGEDLAALTFQDVPYGHCVWPCDDRP